MSYTNSDRYYRDRRSSSCSLKSEDSDLEMDDGSFTNSSSGFSRMNSTYSSSTYSLNDKRRSRNQNEKKRRDQFNLLIQELGNLLNHPRKIDKATVLNETLFFFRNYNEKPLYNKEIDFKFKPFFLQNDEFMRFMIEFQNAFCLVFDLNGDIKYVSDDIIHLMGYFPKNMQNCSIFEFIDENSVKQLKNYLKRKFNPMDHISFECKFKKINNENKSYEPIKIKGFFKCTPNSVDSIGHFNTIAKLDCFMSIGELYPSDNNKREFRSEFSMDLKYTSLDSKATEIIGYSPIEIIGTCSYDYCHLDDLEKLIDCHKKLLQNGAVPLIAYRFRTKGQQWLWIQSRFQILYHQTAMKPYAIMAYNHVISLNEVVESKDLLDVTSFCESLGNTKFSETLTVDTKVEMDNNQVPIQNDQNSDLTESNQATGSNLLMSASNNKTSIKQEKHIDESLGSIFLRSFNDIEYRNYVLSQFKLKKQKIESTIKKHQEELKILEETMDNIRDEKKLASWVLEFQRQEYNSNLYKNNHNFNQSKNEKSSSTSHGSLQTDHQKTQVQNNNQSSQQANYHLSSNESVMVKQNQYDSANQSQYSNKNKNSPLMSQKQMSEEPNFPKNEYQQNYDNNNNLRMNKTQKRSYSSSPAPPCNRNNFNEEAELVGQLINIRKVLPRSSYPNEINNDQKNTLQKNSLSSVNLQSMDMDDLNPEMIDKLLNNYNFESFQN
ncbi:Circadian locomoter output cycles kaput [Brachionus plicatilis]|uniref:Circadian locomoter output cycles kaput n=1 Tax=Brachionus plicatilis TaxID=10195 RepID=A0A3M7RGJ3_BRAPC|nr:Circadian locomoter output cycles kaput [Brachionus plicatilis]